MLIEMVRFLRGYVQFDIHGRFPERFINITSRSGVRLWNPRRCGEVISAAMYMSDYRRARSLARAAGVRLSVREKRGLPACAVRWRGRMGIAVGAFVFLLTVFVMSQFIWNIEITGLDTVSESELRAQLREHGLYIGAFRPAIDSPGVSRSVMLDNSKIGWMAVNISGSCAGVEVKEEATPPEIPNAREPANVKARRDGTILRIEASEGTAVIKEGSGVAAGQLVVSGVMEDKLGGARLVRANARVIARTRYAADFGVCDAPRLLLPDGEQGERRVLYLFGLRIPLSGFAAGASDSASSERTDLLRLMDTDLPVGIVTEHVSGWETTAVELNENSAKELLEKEAQLYELFTLSRCTVTAREYTLTHADGAYTLHAVFDCVEDIAEQSVIGTDEGTDNVRIPRVGRDE